MKFAARIFSFFVFFILSFLVFNTSAFAQQVEQKQNLHNYTQNVMIEVSSSISCLLTGVDPVNPKTQCLGINNGKIGPVDARGGAIGSMGNLITMTFNIPLHTGDYLGYLASNFGVAKSVYAQGNGFDSLAPLTSIWIGFRNVVYILFVIIFVIIGFGIMFRIHIDPRTVMTIENQIPKIIIGLILVTFSLAIAGLLIDLMWIFSYLVIEVFAKIDNSVRTLVTNFQGQNALEIANNLKFKDGFTGYLGVVSHSAGAIENVVSKLTEGLQGTLLGDLLVAIGVQIAFAVSKAGTIISTIGGASIIGQAVKSVATGLLTGVVVSFFGTNILGFVGSLIATIVIAIAVLFALFRLWFTLLKAYIFILLNTALAPFWILAGLLPGSKVSFSGWLRDMAGNLLAFPATLTLFLLAQVFINKFGATQTNGQFVPPLIGNPGQPNAIGGLIGLGMILLAPGIVDMTRKALQAPETDLSAIAKSIGVGMGVGGLPMSAASMGYQLHMASQFGPFKALGERIGFIPKTSKT